MQFECVHCHKPLNLPDSKLPRGRPFGFTCPYCKAKNTAMIPEGAPPPLRPEASGGASPQTAPSEPAPLPDPAAARPSPPTPPRPKDGEAYKPSSEEILADDQEGTADGRPKALVLYDDPETADILVKKLDEINYRAVTAMNPRDAAKQIKFTKFDIMLLQEDYFGSSLTGNHLLRSVQTADSHIRRGTLVVLISPTMATLDDLTAFSISVDAIINSADIGQIGQLLLSSIAQTKKLYSVYEEILAEHGLD